MEQTETTTPETAEARLEFITTTLTIMALLIAANIGPGKITAAALRRIATLAETDPSVLVPDATPGEKVH